MASGNKMPCTCVPALRLALEHGTEASDNIGEKANVKIDLRSRADVKALIDGLQFAMERSDETGGAYYATAGDGKAGVTFMVWLPPKVKGKKR